MRIIYVANHDAGQYDDEGAITHALAVLGHHVQRLREVKGRRASRLRGDVLLFHKWHDVSMLRWFEGQAFRVFWYFDLVDFHDKSMSQRSLSRMHWMDDIVPHVDLGFCTDGDWVAQDKSGKLFWLPQGADQRSMARELWRGATQDRVLFVGTPRGGAARERFVRWMKERYGSRFVHVERGLHGLALREMVQKSRVVVAPDGPVTDRYWSNRLYVMLGHGGFLLHPHSQGAVQQYVPGQELIFYHDREGLDRHVAYYSNPANAENRLALVEAGLRATRERHTYLHRCRWMMEKITERMRGGQHG